MNRDVFSHWTHALQSPSAPARHPVDNEVKVGEKRRGIFQRVDSGGRFFVFVCESVSIVYASIPSEISFEWVYFPPFFFTVLLGYLGAFAIGKLLNTMRLNRFFWHPGLVFVAFWVLTTSLIGLFLIPP